MNLSENKIRNFIVTLIIAYKLLNQTAPNPQCATVRINHGRLRCNYVGAAYVERYHELVTSLTCRISLAIISKYICIDIFRYYLEIYIYVYIFFSLSFSYQERNSVPNNFTDYNVMIYFRRNLFFCIKYEYIIQQNTFFSTFVVLKVKSKICSLILTVR